MKAAVVGHPIAQSRSPQLHTRWIEAFGLDAEYGAVDGESDAGFEAFVRGPLRQHYRGVNVTIPFKGLALALADEASERAKAIGAANQLTVHDGKVYADNTDVIGFPAALLGTGWQGPRTKARILGAGGAAPAVIVALKELGFETIEVTNRSRGKAEDLAKSLQTDVIDWEARGEGLSEVTLLVNTTALGMAGSPDLTGIDVAEMPDTAAVMDIVTTPAATPLVEAARARGLCAEGGLPMLVHQAIPSFAAFFGPRPEDADAAVAFLMERYA